MPRRIHFLPSQMSGLIGPGKTTKYVAHSQLMEICDETVAPQELHLSSGAQVQTGGWERDPKAAGTSSSR